MNRNLLVRLAWCVLFAFGPHVEVEAEQLDITKFGGKADGKTDATQAVLDAWKEACAATSKTPIIVPKGTFLISKNIKLAGPCKAPMELKVQGIFQASPNPGNYDPNHSGWFTIQYVDNFQMNGGGTFDGQGSYAWTKNDCHKTGKCTNLPSNFRFDFVTNAVVEDITSKDSKLFNVNLMGCKNFTFQRFSIEAPETATNVDGIHVGRSNGVFITDCHIKSGDDCISIGDGAQQVRVSKVTCGPGHGISVGSLGRWPNEEPVVGIYVTNCTLTNTMNGVRVKTWPASTVATATDMHFEDIIMENVGNPILVDQEYCPSNKCTKESPSRVKLSKISFKNIRGTSSTQLAMKILCSKTLPCDGVEIGNIDLTYKGPEGPAIAQCTNVHPKFFGKLNPATCPATLPAPKAA